MGNRVSVFECDAASSPIALEVVGDGLFLVDRGNVKQAYGTGYGPEMFGDEGVEALTKGTRLTVTRIDEYPTPHGEPKFVVIAANSNGASVDLSRLLTDPRAGLSECPQLQPVDPYDDRVGSLKTSL